MNLFNPNTRNLWTIISGLGVTDKLNDVEKINIIISNQLIFSWLWLVFPYSLILFFMGLPVLGFLLLGMLLLHILCLFFNHQGYYVLSRVLETTIPSGIIFLMGCLVYTGEKGEYVSVSYYLMNISFFIFPFLIFSLSEKKYILISILVSFIYFFTFPYVSGLLPTIATHTLFYHRAYEILNYLVAAMVLIIGLVYLKILNKSYQDQIVTLLKDTEKANELLIDKNYEIEAQNEEILVQQEEILAQRDNLE